MKKLLCVILCCSALMIFTSCSEVLPFLEENLGIQISFTDKQKDIGNLADADASQPAKQDDEMDAEEIEEIEDIIDDNVEAVEEPIEVPEEIYEEPAIISPEDEWKLMLVNPWNSIPYGYIDTIVLQDLGGGHSMDIRAYPDFKLMVEDAKREGLNLYVGSSFRPHSLQQTYFNSQTNAYINMGYTPEAAREETAKSVAIPGTSEHELGLALDITSTDYKALDDYQQYTPEVVWLQANAWRYGFILRYPEDKYHITHITYEPWHFRYVGREAAKEMYETGLCLEEYLEYKYD